ncbi:MAG: redoxin domain-containing protein [Promethearchaeia archaeon]
MSTGSNPENHGPPQEGQIAPDFVLPATTSEKVQLLEYQGQSVVLVFFPQPFTTFSTMQVRQIIQFHIALQTLGAIVLGISVEPVEALRTFAEQEEIPFPLLSDFERQVAKAYGVFEEELNGFRHVAKPSVFVLDKKQRILYRWVSEDLTELPDFDQILGVIQGFNPSRDMH